MNDTTVHQIMTRILASRMIAPGTKLGERQLAEEFGITRDRMRRVLHRLGHEGRLELVPKRGARTIDPGYADLRTVYEARRILEGGIAISVTAGLTRADLDGLFAQHARECEAIARDDSTTALRLGGALHLRLAELAGNALIVETLRSMVNHTSTALGFIGPPEGPACSCREHHGLLEALASGDPLCAREAMCTHLSLVETRLRLNPHRKTLDLETLVRSELRQAETAAGRPRAPDGPAPNVSL